MNRSESRQETERFEDSKARGLCRVLELSLEENATALSHAAARDVARLMGLPGLEQVIAANARHAAARRPLELVHVLERVRRLMSAAEARGSITPFVEADAELMGLAATLSAIAWGAADASTTAPLATVTLDEALGGRPAPLAAARDATLLASVAAAVRAACDWLSPDVSEGVHVARHDDTLVLGVRVRQFEDLDAAGEVIAETGGSLAPSPRHDGSWDIRVPAHLARPTFLLVEQRGARLALPWHAVLRLRMTAHEMALEEAPVLTLLDGPAAPGDERPAALVALGLRRAWVFADRVVWRLAATPEPADMAPPLPECARFVRDTDGERWWILDPAVLLRGVPAFRWTPDQRAGRDARGVVTEVVDVPAVSPSRRMHVPIASAPPLRVMPSLAAVAVAPVTEDHLPLDGPPPPATLSALDVQPIEASPPPAVEPTAEPGPVDEAEPAAEAEVVVESIAEPTAEPSAEPEQEAVPVPVPAPAAAPQAPARRRASGSDAASARRALVAEDSIVASMFLQRLLTQRGFEVFVVDRCAALMEAVGEPDWAVVFADVRLPDSPAGRHLPALAEHRMALATPFALVALTSDADDDGAARDAGIPDHLRKPFEAAALDRRLAAIGFAAGEVA